MKRIFLAVALLLPFQVWAAESTAGLLQMLDYVGVDYRGAVRGGEVVKQAEYAEMQDFVGGIRQEIDALPASGAKPALQREASRLGALVEEKASGDAVAEQVAAMRKTVMANYEIVAVPRRSPDMALARSLFQSNCATCHGVQGRGDGPEAAGLEPAPTDFFDGERHAQRTLYGLYNTITLGVEGTSMNAFPGLSEHERWSLAFYVGQLGAPANLLEEGQQAWNKGGDASPLASLQSITTVSPAEARAAHGREGEALLTHLRQNPEPLFRKKSSTVAFARGRLIEAGAAYERGDRQEAYEHAVSAYLEGFELAEAALNATDPAMREQIERQMTDFRSLVRSGAPVETVISEKDRLLAALDEAEGRMAGSLSPTGAFAGAFVILLREGLEAILVLSAFIAFLTKTGRRDGMPYLHAGWVGALGAGVLTWYVSSFIIQIGGAGRELTEGAAALFAAAVLFGIGFWMHDKSHAAQWQRFIEERMGKALGAASLWSLALLVFVVVYREIFETILFYQALWVQSTPAGQGMIGAGFGAAMAALTVLAWLVLKYSQRLPLRQFFGVTGAFLLVLAVVFAGKGIAAFQEAGKLPATPLDMPTIDLLGIYPNMESLAVQVAMVIGALAMLLIARRRGVGGASAA